MEVTALYVSSGMKGNSPNSARGHSIVVLVIIVYGLNVPLTEADTGKIWRYHYGDKSSHRKPTSANSLPLETSFFWVKDIFGSYDVFPGDRAI
eukprot:5157436-Ditylum_brightwellii.AAC.1